MQEIEATETKLGVIDGVSQGSELDLAEQTLPKSSMLDTFLNARLLVEAYPIL